LLLPWDVEKLKGFRFTHSPYATPIPMTITGYAQSWAVTKLHVIQLLVCNSITNYNSNL